MNLIGVPVQWPSPCNELNTSAIGNCLLLSFKVVIPPVTVLMRKNYVDIPTVIRSISIDMMKRDLIFDRRVPTMTECRPCRGFIYQRLFAEVTHNDGKEEPCYFS
jgi:hypothetical protein